MELGQSTSVSGESDSGQQMSAGDEKELKRNSRFLMQGLKKLRKLNTNFEWYFNHPQAKKWQILNLFKK